MFNICEEGRRDYGATPVCSSLPGRRELVKTQTPTRRNPIILIVVFATLAIVWFGLRALLQYIPPGILPQTAPTSLFEMDQVVLNGIGEKGREWTLHADNVDISQDRSTANVHGIRDCTMFVKGKPVATLQAENAVCNLWNRKMSISGKVKVFSKAGQRMETSALTWEPYGSILESTGKVTYHSPNGDAQADKLILNLETRELTLTKPRISLWIGEIENLR